jgi:uracil-DNA glycosylase family 4
VDKEGLYRDISALLKNDWLSSRLVLFRGEGDRDRLAGWLCREEQAGTRARDDDIRSLIESCNQCAGIEEKKFGIGTGANRVMVILNAPQLVNILEKKVLKKESVDMLKKMLQAAGLSFADCYVTNLVKCDVNDPLLSPSQVVKNCERIMAREIEIMKPRIVIVFGDIIPLQKIVKGSTDIQWYNIEHPITLIRNPDLKRPAWSTLKLVMAKMKELNLS